MSTSIKLVCFELNDAAAFMRRSIDDLPKKNEFGIDDFLVCIHERRNAQYAGMALRLDNGSRSYNHIGADNYEKNRGFISHQFSLS